MIDSFVTSWNDVSNTTIQSQKNDPHWTTHSNFQMSFETPAAPYNASDPYASFLNASCLDLLLIEIVPMAYRIANELPLTPKDADKSVDEEEQREAAFRRLESLGYRVGQGLVERLDASLATHALGELLWGVMNGCWSPFSVSDFRGIVHVSQILWMRSSFCARTCGLWFFASKLIIWKRIIGWVKFIERACILLNLSTYSMLYSGGLRPHR